MLGPRLVTKRIKRNPIFSKHVQSNMFFQNMICNLRSNQVQLLTSGFLKMKNLSSNERNEILLSFILPLKYNSKRNFLFRVTLSTQKHCTYQLTALSSCSLWNKFVTSVTKLTLWSRKSKNYQALGSSWHMFLFQNVKYTNKNE